MLRQLCEIENLIRPTVCVLVAGLFAATVLAVPALAEIPEPQHVVYGLPTDGGQAVSSGSVSLVLDGADEALVSYEIGSSEALGELYALRIPMAYGLPREPGTARAGDTGTLYLDDRVAARVTVGAPGKAQRLDFEAELDGRLPGLSIADASGRELSAGPQGFDVTIHLRLAFPTQQNIEVDWHTLDGTAVATADYRAAGGRLSLPAGATSAELEVTIYDDTVAEASPELHLPGEHFFVELSSVFGARLLDDRAKVTILDDDTAPAISIADSTVIEPDSGSRSARFEVGLSHPWHEVVTVDYFAQPRTADADDFVLAPGTLTFPPGTIRASLEAQILGDGVEEEDESFLVRLENPSTSRLLDDRATGTILGEFRFLSYLESHHDGQAGLEGLDGVIDLAVSPDGAHLYVASRGDHTLSVFEHRPDSGRLRYVTHYGGSEAADGGDAIDDLLGLRALAISPDGRHLYAAAFDDNALSVFERDEETGRLTLLEVEKDGATDMESGLTIDGLGGVIALALDPRPSGPGSETTDPGGHHLYAVGYDDDALAVFERDPETGILTFVEALRDGELGIDGLRQPTHLALSPDGSRLYATGSRDHTLAVFERDPTDGRLGFVESHVDGFGGVDGLASASAVAVSPDGSSVYVAGQDDSALAIFERTDEGNLRFLATATTGADGAGSDALELATDVAVSFDGRYVYAAGFLNDAVAVFERSADGSLGWIETEREGQAGVEGLEGTAALAVAMDDGNVYAAGNLAAAIVAFRRDITPPEGPADLHSPSHDRGVFSNLPVIELEWSQASDPEGGVLEGYWLIFDGSADTVPKLGDSIPDGNGIFVPHGDDPHRVSSPVLADSDTIYAHLLTCDQAGNCDTARHAGPFRIDTAPPAPIVDLVSPSHGLAQPSSLDRIELAWSTPPDLAGVVGYAVHFDASIDWACDGEVDLPGDAVGTLGPAMADGTIFAHVCAVDALGHWSEVARLGPFVIDTSPPSAVGDLHSPSHVDDAPSADTTIDLAWQSADDLDGGSIDSGIGGYAVGFSRGEQWECDQQIDVAGAATTITSNPLAGGRWWAHVCAVDGAGNWGPVATAGPWQVATDMATITGVSTAADTGDGRLEAEERTAVSITQIYLDFDRAMHDPAGDSTAGDVTHIESYRLVAAADDGAISTTSCTDLPAGDDQWIAIDRVDYEADAERSVLHLQGDHSLATGRYRLLACGDRLGSAVGGVLDGDGDGIGGDDFHLDFEVSAGNRLANPNFDNGLGSWSTTAPSAGDIGHSAEDGDGLTTTGSAHLSSPGDLAGEPFALDQCLGIDAPTTFTLRGRARIGSPASDQPTVLALVEAFADDACTEPVAGGPLASPALEGDSGGLWSHLATRFATDEVTRSIRISFVAQAEDESSFDVHFDLLFLGDSLLVFTDGFESGDTSAWH